MNERESQLPNRWPAIRAAQLGFRWRSIPAYGLARDFGAVALILGRLGGLPDVGWDDRRESQLPS